MKRRAFLGASAIAIALPATAISQTQVPTVGLLWVEPAAYRNAFLDAMKQKGYVADRSIRYLDRTVREGYGAFEANAQALVRAKVDVIVTYGGTSTASAVKATREIPIVELSGLDPVALGWAASMSRPGGNVTGISTIIRDLVGKRVELLKEVLPKLSLVGLLRAPESSVASTYLQQTESTAHLLNLRTTIAEVRMPGDLERAFQDFSKTGAEAFIVVPSSFLFAEGRQIVELAAKYRLPTVYPIDDFMSHGGLMSYSPDFADEFRKLADYVDRVLKGAKPGDLPIEQPTKILLMINLKTAKALGLKIPQSILLRADRVIE